MVTRRKKERRAKSAREKRKRSSLTGSPEEFPPAEPEKPTFFPRDLQAMLPFRGKKNLASALRGVNERQLPAARLVRSDGGKGSVQYSILHRFAGSAQPQNALKLVVVAAVGV